MLKKQTYDLELKITENGIQSNLNEIKQAIDSQYGKYITLVEVNPSVERIKELKEVRSSANKLIKTLDDERKKAVNTYKNTIVQAKSMVDETMESAVLASNNIKSIVDLYELEQEDKRKAEIEVIYNNLIKEKYPNIHFDFEQLWLALFYKDLHKSLQDETVIRFMTVKLDKMSKDIDTIKMMTKTSRLERATLLMHYVNSNYDLRQAIEKYSSEKNIRETISKQIGEKVEKKKEKILTCSFTVTATETQLKLLSEYLKENNIKYKAIK